MGMSSDPPAEVQPATAEHEQAAPGAPLPGAEEEQRPEGPHPPGGVKRAVIGSALWTMFGFGTMQVFRFASNIALTWLLLPDVFGLMALVDVFLLGLNLFSDFGLAPSVVRSPRGEDRAFLNTAWTVQVLRGVGLFAAACLIAWPVAAFYDEPHLPSLMWLLPAAGLTALLNGFNATALYSLERRLRQGPLVLLEMSSYVFSISVTVLWVLLVQPTVWALIIGRVSGSFVELAGSHLLARGFRNRFHWDRSAVHELLHFGKWVFAGTVCTFLADRSDRLVVGKLQSLGLLGVYNIAAQLAVAPRDLMYALIFKLIFPLYGRMREAGREMRLVFSRVHPVTVGLGGFLVAGVIGAGPTAIRCLFREEYHAAGWMVQLLAAGVWLTILEAAEDAVLYTLGLPRISALSNAAKAASLPVLVPLGFWAGGFVGLIVGFVMADFVRYALTAWATRRQGLPVLRIDLLLTLCLAVSSAAALGLGSLRWLQEEKWLRFAVEVAAVVLLWGSLALAGWWQGFFRIPRPEVADAAGEGPLAGEQG